MFPIRCTRPCTPASILAAVVLSPLPAMHVAAADCITLELAAGAERAEYRDKIDLLAALETVQGGQDFDAQEAVVGCVEFRDGGEDFPAVEAAIVLAHPATSVAPDLVRLQVDDAQVGRIYREVLPGGTTTRGVRMTLNPGATTELSGTQKMQAWRETQLILIMQRNRDRCTMSATVSGDVSRHYFGDVAYFNDLQGAAVKEGMAGGSLADPDSQARMGDFIEGMEAMVRSLQEMGYDTPGIDDESDLSGGREDFAAFIEDELRAGDDEAGDDFGLNLAAIQLDGDYGKSRAAAAALLGSSFTLNLSGSVSGESVPGEAPAAKWVTPGSITATIGLSDEGDKIPFVLPAGTDPTVRFDFIGEGVATGRLVTPLVTEGSYTVPGVADNERIQIRLDARFVARRGAFGCMR